LIIWESLWSPFSNRLMILHLSLNPFPNCSAAHPPHIPRSYWLSVTFARRREDFNSFMWYFDNPTVSIFENQRGLIRNQRPAAYQCLQRGLL
jgi:hypothetical protein